MYTSLISYEYDEVCETPTEINSTELCPYRKAASWSVTQEIPNISWKLKVHFLITIVLHQSVSEHDLSDPYHPYLSLWSILLLFNHLRLGSPMDAFPSGFSTKVLYTFYWSPLILHALPSSFSRLHHSNYTWRSVLDVELLVTQFSSASYHFMALVQDICFANVSFTLHFSSVRLTVSYWCWLPLEKLLIARVDTGFPPLTEPVSWKPVRDHINPVLNVTSHPAPRTCPLSTQR